MSFRLDALKNTSRPYKRRKVVGRGPGSGRGKTCGRGHKGQGSRSGSGLRQGYIGGGVPLHRRIPTRGFTRGRFLKRLDVVNLGQIEEMYSEGETVSVETLRQKGYLSGPSHGVKVLGDGDLKKKVTFQVEAMSKPAKEKLKAAQIPL